MASLIGPVLGLFCDPAAAAAPKPARAFDMRPWLRLLAAAALAWLAGEEGCAGRLLEEWWLTEAAVCGTECWWCADLSLEPRRSAGTNERRVVGVQALARHGLERHLL